MVYLIHIEQPLKPTSHYITYAEDLDARIEPRRKSGGSRLMGVIAPAGITWRLARAWEGGRDLERRLKKRHQAPLLCPICSGDAAQARASLEPKSVKITMSHRDQIVFCLRCPLEICVSAEHPQCPIQAEQIRRNGDHYERMKASGWVEKRKERREVLSRAKEKDQ